jgi:hypothetical protein
MISIDTVISYIQATGYQVLPAKVIETNLQDITELPIIYVSYYSVQKDPNSPPEQAYFNSYGEDLFQTFEVQIVCLLQDYPTIWKKVYSSLKGKTPSIAIGSTESPSGLTFHQGAVQQSNGKIWDVSRWNIGFPTTDVNF